MNLPAIWPALGVTAKGERARSSQRTSGGSIVRETSRLILAGTAPDAGSDPTAENATETERRPLW